MHKVLSILFLVLTGEFSQTTAMACPPQFQGISCYDHDGGGLSIDFIDATEIPKRYFHVSDDDGMFSEGVLAAYCNYLIEGPDSGPLKCAPFVKDIAKKMKEQFKMAAAALSDTRSLNTTQTVKEEFSQSLKNKGALLDKFASLTSRTNPPPTQGEFFSWSKEYSKQLETESFSYSSDGDGTIAQHETPSLRVFSALGLYIPPSDYKNSTCGWQLPDTLKYYSNTSCKIKIPSPNNAIQKAK